MASSLNNPAWLEWMTTLMGGECRGRRYAATLPPDRFYCLLDELPLHLIPQRALRSLRLQEDRHQSSLSESRCILCAAGQVPDELASQKELLSGFALQGTIAWVRNPASGSLLPFWLGPQLERILRGLRPERASAIVSAGQARCLLAAADILISEPNGSPS